MTENEIIAACKREERKAQKLLYERYSPAMFGVCRRYLKSREDAEDVLVEGFFKVFSNILQYRGSGSFEGWIRRIIVNEALMLLRKKHHLKKFNDLKDIDTPIPARFEDELAAQDILELLNQLPIGYRTVFNLYVLEGYKHREIAEMLGISINTSKSQLILAKKRMRAILIESDYPGVKNRQK
ncbi:MAG: RNA polymerase sigma factor [Bacteroidetes bacterium]|nr:RNA polymerase sigma factor [Bacteroidota bacterium]